MQGVSSLGRILVILLLGSSATASLARPWIGVVVAYLFVVLAPQTIWWWQFDGLRPALWVVLPTIVGLGIAILRGLIDFKIIANQRTFCVLTLWAFITVSYFFGPYVDTGGPYRFTDPEWAISTMHKIVILYFLACLCIDSELKLKWLVWVLIGSGVYLIYWGNMQYLSGRAFGRVPGPKDLDGGGIYADENNFAMLFVVVLPFIWYMSFAIEQRIIRWVMWLAIPFGWHAVFLTGSRGGLVGIAVTMLLTVWRMKSKWLGILMIPAFVIAFVWQAGDLMRDRAGGMSEFQTEASAAGRLQAWEAATRMTVDKPVTGVGIASFGPAFPDYSTHQPREAHNTFFQIAAESGLIAGLMYLFLVAGNLFALWTNGKRLLRQTADRAGTQSTLYWINEAVLVGFSGLVVCSMFLSLQLFEIFYCLTVMANALMYLARKQQIENEQAPLPVRNSAATRTTARSRQ